MLGKLRKLIKKEGMMKVAADMGYRSQTTINNWIKNNKIPTTATARVEKYLSTKGETK